MSGPNQPIHVALARIAHRLLMNPRGWRVDALKEELGIADSTYRKYRKILQRDFDFLLDETGRTRVEEIVDGDARYLRLRELSDEQENERIGQVVAYTMARGMLGFLAHTDLYRDADGIFRDLLRSAKSLTNRYHLTNNLDRLIYSAPWAPKDYAGKNDIIKQICRGLFYRHRVRITYRALGAPIPREHVLEPLTLLEWKSGLYMVGRNDRYPDPATYAIDRIETVEVLSERFTYPSPAEYSPKKLMDGSFGVFREPGHQHHVELIFANDPALKQYLRERRWHPTQQWVDMPDGRLKMMFTVNSLVEVDPWVRGFGEKVVSRDLRGGGEDAKP